MKEVLLTALSLVLSILIVSIGLLLATYCMSKEFGFLTCIIGLIGYSISVRPAITEWEERFKRWFKIK
jgi:hypothetical protein